MRILVLSDSHNRPGVIENAYKLAGKVSGAIFLGDGTDEFQRFSGIIPAPVWCVKGNCDYCCDLALSAVAVVEGHRLLICHGHTFGVNGGFDRLAAQAARNDCEAALFGHIHCRVNTQINGVHLFSPGSVALPRDGLSPSAGIITEEAGKLKYEHIDV